MSTLPFESPQDKAKSQLKALRGAILVADNTQEAITEATKTLFSALINRNHLTAESCVTVFYSLTSDLTKENPAKVVRHSFGWGNTAMFCSQEPAIEGFPKRCIRILLQFYPVHGVNHRLENVYLNGAECLRPDLHD